MAKVDIWMPLYIGDYLSDTMHLGALDHGAYLLLIMHHWMTGPLPDDDKKLRRIAKLSPEEWEECRDTLADFFTIEGGFWTHDRVNQELEAAEKRRKAASENGKKGGRPRKGRNPEKSHGLQKGKPNETQKKPIGFETETHSFPLGKAKQNPEKSSSPSPSHIKTPVPEEEVTTELDKYSEGEQVWGDAS